MRHDSIPARVLIAAATTAVTGLLPLAGTASATPDGKPLPPVTVLADKGTASRGDIFVSPNSANTAYSSGVEILSGDGRRVVWSHKTPAGQQAADFRAQTYRGRPVLTWWQGTGLGSLASGVDYVYDDRYQKVAEVRAGNGYTADGHEFLITGRGTALILAYKQETADLTGIGGSAHQAVIDGVVQEVDIRTGRVLFQWRAADHVPYAQSEQPLPSSPDKPWDWFHINAVKPDTDGDLLVDARNTWTTYKVDRHDGTVLWQLGGKAGTFREQAAPGQYLNTAGTIFSWQHDPEPLGGGLYSWFDNESAGAANTGAGAVEELPFSRVVTVRVNEKARTATLVKSVDQPDYLSASSQGNAQPLSGGGKFVGWGSLPYFSEFNSSGEAVFKARFPTGVNSYRAYRFPWK
ncbi:arylsulfotransferase family protein [Streptomyces sp. NPDC006739]|uniref:arylsulfotransferase family protein n=1 Tax=Streptomyces sp. NPDC006739 TaxID=3364763 RepID=UPI0036943B49